MVDDEPDVCETVKEALASSQVATAGSFDEGIARITSESFDLVVLDIMGVNGFALLEACRANKLPAAMLTAHAVNVESLNLAVKLGAVSFLPKEELQRLPELIAEILEGLEQGRLTGPNCSSAWGRSSKISWHTLGGREIEIPRRPTTDLWWMADHTCNSCSIPPQIDLSGARSRLS